MDANKIEQMFFQEGGLASYVETTGTAKKIYSEKAATDLWTLNPYKEEARITQSMAHKNVHLLEA